MNNEEIMKEILAKLPAEIAEKVKAETITEEELKEYVLPLAEQYKEQLEGIAPLSEEQLEEVSGGGLIEPNSFICFFAKWGSYQNKKNNMRTKCREAGYYD